MNNKKYFFGWGNIKKVITEIIRIYSNKRSFFSKKRIESGIAFIIAQWGMVFYLLKKYPDLTMMDISMWAAIEFGISGYIIHQIQKEKKTNDNSEENNQ
jgi:hypothetical protein|tara:strand:+ start:5171 stop:5467 length:297 start_codon:yes stop_codon:yes gene_type:complete